MKLIRPVLKYLHSPDVLDFSSYHPEEDDNFGFLLQAMIGPEGTEGEESFDIMVVTPKWLQKRVAEVDIFLARHYLIVREYDMNLIRKFINNYIERSSAETWHESALRLSRLGHWEFEDYQTYEG
jgi:hypothetical protein